MRLDLLLKETKDQGARENFERLQDIFAKLKLLDGDWYFFDVDLPTAGLNEVKHNLTFAPKDVILLSAIGDQDFYFKYQQFDRTNMYIQTSGPVRIRFFAGVIKEGVYGQKDANSRAVLYPFSKTDIGTLETDIETLESDVEDLQSDISDIEGDISNIQSALVAPTVQKFTSGSGTYTTPAGVKWIRVRMIGGGGGGGGNVSNGSSGGGGSGGYIEAIITNPAASYSYAVGTGGQGGAANTNGTAGGDTTFGNNIAGGGGAGGSGTNGQGGAGGTATLVDGVGLAIEGSGGTSVQNSNAAGTAGGMGGAGFFGGSGGAGNATNGAGRPGKTNSGSGGGGGNSTAGVGGAGAAGIIIVEEYYN